MEHMVGLLAVRGNNGKPYVFMICPFLELCMVITPHPLAFCLYLIARFQLRVQESSENVRRKIARTEIHPSVLVHLAAEKATSIGSLLTDNFGSLDILRIVDQKGTALTTTDVLGFMKALRCQTTKRTKIFPFVLPK